VGEEREDAASGGDLGRLGAEDLQRLQAGLGQIRDLHDRMERLLEAVLAISSELELDTALRTIVEVSADLVDARYGALGVLNERGEFADLFTCGVSDEVYAAIGRMPTTHGLLEELVAHPRPLRVDDVPGHPRFREFPPGHPPMRTLLGTPILVRGTVYGNMYFADKRSGEPFTGDDERIIAALASTAGVAIENARLYERIRRSTEDFQRSLLPRLPDLGARLWACARYHASGAVAQIGGDWYDAFILPDGATCLMVGDVMGHDLRSASLMSRISNMLRVLAYEHCEPPSRILQRLDEVLHALYGGPMATVLLARLEEHDPGWRLRWGSAGHLPPLLVPPDGPVRYLRANGGHPLGVTPELARPDHEQIIDTGSTLVIFTDGLVEDPVHGLDEGMDSLARAAADLRHLPLDEMCEHLLAHRGEQFTDDVALLALRLSDHA
jgi:hypothetical protein